MKPSITKKTEPADEDASHLKILVWGAESSADLRDFCQALPHNHIETSQPKRSSQNDAHFGCDSAPPLKSSPYDIQVMLNWDTTPRRNGHLGRPQHRGDPCEHVSDWFNYGFNESTFKEWVRWQLEMRHEKLNKRKGH